MKFSVNKSTATAASLFMCAVLCATYLISTTPENTDSGGDSRSLGDAVQVSNKVNAVYDPLEPLKEELANAYINGEIDSDGLITAFINAEKRG